MKIKIATFNVNSVKARLENVLSWLKNSQIDIALLQELKCEEENFPFEAFFDLGYNAAVFGQKTYNGVAILSKFKIEDVVKGLPEFKEDLGVKTKITHDLFGEETQQNQMQARYIEAVIPIHGKAIRVASVYVPNGGGDDDVDDVMKGEKFNYKLNFLSALKSHFSKLLAYDEIAIFGGDFNVAHENIDVYDAKNLAGTICFHDEERKKFRAILNLGLLDAYRVKNPQNQAFSWWDYRGNSWQYNKGMRIDYLLASPRAMDVFGDCQVMDKGVRDLEKASDHCPVVGEIEI